MKVILKNGKVGTLVKDVHVKFDDEDEYSYSVPSEDILKLQNNEEEKIINENIIENILNTIGIRINCKGYDFWVEAIKYYLENDHKNFSITKELYQELAKKFNTGEMDIERTMRYAINRSQDDIKNYFHINYRITNYGFLKIMSKEYLKIENTKI